MMISIYEGTGENDGGGTGKLLGTAASDQEAQSLVSVFPGSGQCHFWSVEERRLIRIVSWQNRLASN